ncbi:MAG: hypothetical protein HYW01_12415 [Deltaproteobacteria bacterium]|nr:hypothetical protein [Deltaproteobacteria bacterium]
MKNLLNITIAFIFLFLIGVSNAKPDETQVKNEATQYTGSKEFERIKTLAGTWEGTSSMGEKGEKVSVKYQVTSGGSAVVETLFPDTPHEMVSVYDDETGKLSMTHYCMLKNHPDMVLKSADENTINLDFADGQAFDPTKEPHMHSLSISFKNKDNMIQKWTMYENGKEIATFTLSRAH